MTPRCEVARPDASQLRTPPRSRRSAASSFDLAAGQRLGLIGESGSGKTVTALAVMGLLPENAHVTGSIRLRRHRARRAATRPASRGCAAT